MNTEAMKNATPAHGWITRHTDSPPNRCAIHPKTGVQIGIPVNRQTKNVSATVQWINRDARLWRTISLPTTTSSVVWAAITAGSIGRWGVTALHGVFPSRAPQG